MATYLNAPFVYCSDLRSLDAISSFTSSDFWIFSVSLFNTSARFFTCALRLAERCLIFIRVAKFAGSSSGDEINSSFSSATQHSYKSHIWEVFAAKHCLTIHSLDQGLSSGLDLRHSFVGGILHASDEISRCLFFQFGNQNGQFPGQSLQSI
eukprot:GABU01003523.1.p1 GENE.GABU01003523.1~~GABU01003523.1.p1  ORF type:complete len:152 (-),score=12.11 GABU01003523.1:2-457(-)